MTAGRRRGTAGGGGGAASGGRAPRFYGWRVVWALLVVLTFSAGLGFYNNTIMLQALARDSGFAIETASSAVSLFFITSALAGLAIAPLMERVDVRWIIGPGALVGGLALMALGRVTTGPGLFAAYAVFGAAFCASGLLPATTLIARWFAASRAKALSVASTGLSLGGMLLTPLSATLVEALPLAEASIWLGLLYFFGIVPASLALRSRPEELGLHPDGAAALPAGAADGMAFRPALLHSYYWLFAGAYVFVMAAQVGGIAHQYGLLTERLTQAQASLGLAVLPLCSVVGRLAGGWLLDFISTRRFTLLMMLLQGAALALLGQATSLPGLYLSLALFGVTVGNLLMLQPLILAEVYGLRDYARLYAWSQLVIALGIAGGPGLLGFLYAEAGGYGQPYLVAGGLGFLAAILYYVAKPPQGQAT